AIPAPGTTVSPASRLRPFPGKTHVRLSPHRHDHRFDGPDRLRAGRDLPGTPDPPPDDRPGPPPPPIDPKGLETTEAHGCLFSRLVGGNSTGHVPKPRCPGNGMPVQ